MIEIVDRNEEYEKYSGMVTRTDLNYTEKNFVRYLKVSKYDFENDIETVIDQLKKNNLRSLEIHNGWNFTYPLDCTNFEKLTFLEELTINNGDYFNEEKLYLLKDLIHLVIAVDQYNKVKFDLSHFSKLTVLKVGGYMNNFYGFEKLINLRSLLLQKYKPISGDLIELKNLENLTMLEMIQVDIKSLKGIENFKHLKCLDLGYLPKLETLDNIQMCNDLEHIVFDKLTNLKDYSALFKIKNLSYLDIMRSAKIESIQLMSEMKNLKNAYIVETDIIDGNLDPLIKIKHHGYTNKRHYNYYSKNFIDYKKDNS